MTVHDVLARLREGSYVTPDGKTRVAFTDAQTFRDALDLYALLDESHTTGSSNLENDQVRAILTDLYAGKQLDDAQHGVMARLLAKYKDELAKLRRSPDREGQDYLGVPPQGTGRLSPASGSR